jgi:CheY-like chemotaxis protein
MTLHAAGQGSDLVKRMMAFSRTQTLEPETIDLHEFLERVGELLEHTLGGKIELEMRIDEDVWSPVVDSSQLELSILNLAINARDAMPDGGTLEIVCRNAPAAIDNDLDLAPGDYVRIDVIDTGCGMTDDVIAKVMEPFFTTKEVGKGTGLGLSTVHGFAHQSGGTVELTSHVGSGTTGSLWIPRSTNAVVRQQDLPDQSDREDQALKVLLVDDHDGVRMVTAEMLAEMGHDVTQAASPREFDEIMALGIDDFDLLVTDLAMPLESGDQLILKARTVRPNLPAIIITGHLDHKILDRMPSDVETLPKPFTPSKFLRAIRKCQS